LYWSGPSHGGDRHDHDSPGFGALSGRVHPLAAVGPGGADGLHRERAARKVAADRAISTVDVETRHTRKSKSNRRDGFRGHVAAEPETGLITDCELTKASGEAGSDPVVGEQMISRDRYHRVDVDVDVDAVSWPQSADEEKVSAEPVTDSDAAPTAADSETATADADAADNPQPDAADEQQGRGLQVYGDSSYGTGEPVPSTGPPGTTR